MKFGDIKAVATEFVHDKFTSTRLIMVVGFVVAAIWFKSLLTDHVIDWDGALILTYIIMNSVTKAVTLLCNTAVKVTTIKALSQDGTLTAEEQAAIAKA